MSGSGKTFPGLVEFEPVNYYKIISDPSIKPQEYSYLADFNPAGAKLIIQYYQHKYHTNICIQNLKIPNISIEQNFRQAYLLGFDSEHAIPVIFIQENGQRAFLYLNSTGIDTAEIYQIQTLSELGIKVFAVEELRQVDSFSCRTDAMIMARDCTAKNAKESDYRIPNLLKFLEGHAAPEENKFGYYKAKLPKELLLTTQYDYFLEVHEEKNNDDKLVHKKETLGQFRERYSIFDENLIVNAKPKFQLADYLRSKSLKFIGMIEIQFYVNQLEKLFSTTWTATIHQKFITDAKKLLAKRGKINAAMKQYSRLHDFVVEFINKQNVVEKVAPDAPVKKQKVDQNPTDFKSAGQPPPRPNLFNVKSEKVKKISRPLMNSSRKR